jgi:hypothetical protein
MRPRHFWVQTTPPSDGQPGAIEESHYIVEDGTVTLTDAIGNPLFGERHQRKLGPEDDEMAVARQLLQQGVAAGSFRPPVWIVESYEDASCRTLLP